MQTATKVTALKSAKINAAFESLLENTVEGKGLLNLRKGAKLFSQGAEADAIYFIRAGKVRVTVISAQGKEAVLAVLGPRDFLGEGCLVGDSVRTSTATSIQPSTVFRIEKRAMLQALHVQPELSETFVASLLARNVELEENLCDQLFNHSERRLARVLLKLSRFAQHDKLPDTKVPRLTHKILAEIVGTTRPRITSFMNKFRTLGLINYKRRGDITVMAKLLTDVVLHD
jgi:CRP/FNR family transcriptional regulator, cyclic AMP receptor protein